jgi:hypothetical protein
MEEASFIMWLNSQTQKICKHDFKSTNSTLNRTAALTYYLIQHQNYYSELLCHGSVQWYLTDAIVLPTTNKPAGCQTSQQTTYDINLAVSQYETSMYDSWGGRWWSQLGLGYSKSMITAVTFHTFTFWVYFKLMQTFGRNLSVSSFYLSICDQIYTTTITEFYRCLMWLLMNDFIFLRKQLNLTLHTDAN